MGYEREKARDPISTVPPESLNDEVANGITSNARSPAPAPAVVPDSLAYQILKRFCQFRNKNQEDWWHGISPVLVTFLVAAGYKVCSQYDYLRLFRDHVYHALDVLPRSLRPPTWKSRLTPFHTPAQFDLIQHDDKTTVQFSYEPIGPEAGTPSDPFNREALSNALDLLSSGGVSYNTELLHIFEEELVLSDQDAALLQETGKQIDHKPVAILSLKLGHEINDISVGCILSPVLKSISTNSPRHELIFGAIRRIDHDYRFAEALSVVAQYWSSSGGSETRELVSIGWDMVEPHKSSIRLYIAEWNVSFQSVRDFFTLKDRRKNAATMSGVADMRELWRQLDIPEKNLKAPLHSLEANSPSFFSPLVFCFELLSGNPEPKLHASFPVDDLDTEHVTQVLRNFHDQLGWKSLRRSLDHSVQEAL
ncbi:hypothetical protein FQN57_006307 [Myotisia sp. PD_48]|nr:hypothetical protein FQN57_006307 [Myotisia sp. PD_48]